MVRLCAARRVATTASWPICWVVAHRRRKSRRIINPKRGWRCCWRRRHFKDAEDQPMTERETSGSAQGFVTGNGDERRTLVVVFLRGGADGLNLVAPLEDDGYYRARPRIALTKSQTIALD